MKFNYSCSLAGDTPQDASQIQARKLVKTLRTTASSFTTSAPKSGVTGSLIKTPTTFESKPTRPKKTPTITPSRGNAKLMLLSEINPYLSKWSIKVRVTYKVSPDILFKNIFNLKPLYLVGDELLEQTRQDWAFLFCRPDGRKRDFHSRSGIWRCCRQAIPSSY